MRPVDVAPLVEHGHDLVLLIGGEPVDRAPARRRVVETLTIRDAATPPLEAALGQLQQAARRPGAAPARPGAHDQIHERCLGGRIHPAWDSATQPQGSFPSTSVNRTAISANAVRRRSISPWAASSSTSRCLSRRPGRDREAARARPAGRPRAASRSSTGPPAPDRLPRPPWSPHAPAASRSRTSPAVPGTASSSCHAGYSTGLLNAQSRTLPCWLKPTTISDTNSDTEQREFWALLFCV